MLSLWSTKSSSSNGRIKLKMFFINLWKLINQRPVYFQPLDQELIPVFKYLNGYVLNAGCGERDISNLLLSNKAEKVDNCDLNSSIPNAINCDLTEFLVRTKFTILYYVMLC